MSNELLRLECLRLAMGFVSMSETKDDSEVIRVAESLYKFIQGQPE